MSYIYYIIEHPTRGTLKDDYEYNEFHFSPTNLRSDERNARFFSIEDAMRVLDNMAKTSDRFNKIARLCQVRASTYDETTRTGWPVVDTWPPRGFKS